MATTQPGVPAGAEKTVRNENITDEDKAKDAELKAKFDAAKIKGFEDLPDDHPMARRAAMMADIERINNEAEGVGDEPPDVSTAIARAADDSGAALPISAFTDPPADTRKTVKPAPAPAKDKAAAAAAEVTELLILDAADLAKYQVRTKIDGVDELVPATKALGTYQKGAAADVRLAAATKAQREAEAALAAARAAPAPATAAPAATLVQDTAAADKKFEEASEALYGGDPTKAATLFSEAVRLAQPAASGRRDDSAIDTDALVGRVTAGVKQQLSQQSALDQLFTDYPDIKNKRAFQIVADEYAAAFVANGDSAAVAIHKAGEAIGEEYHLGKWAPAAAAAASPVGRPLKSEAPTTRAGKLSAKEELDTITSGNASSVSTEPQEPSVVQQLEEMRKARPGQAL